MNQFGYIRYLEAIVKSLLTLVKDDDSVMGINEQGQPKPLLVSQIKARMAEKRPELERFERAAIALERSLLPWDCESSPDKYCHYSGEVQNNKLKLLNGETIDVIVSDDNYYENCIFCGEPDERK